MPSSGAKKKDNLSRMERHIVHFPQLSNEKQLSIMNKVKNGEMSIEDALDQARKDCDQMSQQAEEEQVPSQYNFSVHKHGRYRWQKRILQIDFKTKMLCSIEKGIIKRQLPFLIVKSCDDGVGSRFSISFKGHHDYELEATSVEDKLKMMQLVNQIIYGNIYSDPIGGDAEALQQPQVSNSLREGVLLLHRGGLASFKWVKYEVQLHPGQLTMAPFNRRGDAVGEVTSSMPVSTVIHLSDGGTSVQSPPGSDTFTLTTHRNNYQFRVPVSDETADSGSVQGERDAWVKAISKLCSEWKRKSQVEHLYVETVPLQHVSIAENTEDTDTDVESSGGTTTNVLQSHSLLNIDPPADNVNTTLTSAGDTSPSAHTRPVPKPRRLRNSSTLSIGADNLPPIPSPTSPVPSSPAPLPQAPSHAVLEPPSAVPQPLKQVSVVKDPSPKGIPAPPPLPFKKKTRSCKTRTRAFHWDIVGSEKIAKSIWTTESGRKIEIDTSRLYQQFRVNDLGMHPATEPANVQHIMLNQKIAHNFNIFLKSFPVQPGELKDKLFIINEDDGGLSDEHITALRRYVPTPDDVEMYKSCTELVTELHIVDQYMFEMCHIPYLSTQLDLLLTLRELPISMNDLQPLISQKIRMCTQLNDCGSFVSVLEYLLAVGNYLNENAGKGKARGFRLSSLTKLSQLRGRDKNFTLLHALVEQIMLHEPRLASFTQELAEFETVPGASIKGLTAEVDVLQNELKKVIQYRKTSKKRNAAAQNANFSKDLKLAVEKYNKNLSELTKTCEEMKKLYSVILVKFGEPADQDSQELFRLLGQFVLDFKKAHADVMG